MKTVSAAHLGRAFVVILAVLIPAQGAAASDFWDEVRTPGLREYRREIVEARAALRAGSFDQALAHAELALARLGQRPEAHAARGRALGGLRRDREACTALSRALEIDESSLDDLEDGAHASVIAATAGSYELAARILSRVLGRLRAPQPRHELYALYGDVLLSLGPERLQEAILAYREAVRVQGPGATRVMIGLALALRRSGERLEAADLAREVAGQGRIDATLTGLPVPESERAARRAIVLAAIGDQEGARQAWTEASTGAAWANHARAELQEPAARPPRRRSDP